MALVRDEAYWAHVRAVVDSFPPLTQEQRAKLALILRLRPGDLDDEESLQEAA